MSTYHSTPNDLVERPNTVDVSPDGWCLFLFGRSYIGRNLTDGFIPDALLPRLSPVTEWDRAAQDLVASGIWAITENGYTDVDYLPLNRSRTQVEENRAKEAEKKRRQRGHVPRDVPSVSPGDSAGSPALSDTDPDAEIIPPSSEVTHADLDERERDRFDQVITAIVAHLEAKRTEPPDNVERWRKRVTTQRRGQHGDLVARLVRTTEPDTPPDLIAAAALGERATTLDHHIKDPAA